VWEPVKGTLSAKNAEITPDSFKAFTLDKAGLKATLGGAAKSRGAASAETILELPAPNGGTQRFKVHEYSIMEPGLAAKHPDIKTYAGHGLDDPTASVVADTTPQGFHAAVRTQSGGWYVDPYYKDSDDVYVSYFTRDAPDRAEAIAETEPFGEEIKSSGTVASDLGPEIQLRTYRLALVTDPSYATYHGAANVTAAKVTLINRVNQIYETESAIRMILVADTDKLNLNTVALATGANGPCGSAPCYTATNSCSPVLSRNRIAIGQIIGASAYDVGHIAMGNSGGGVANLGVIGGNNKAGGCTGLATPIGDYFAVDYVAHEIGHQFAGNHTFNGTQGNCGGNRSGQTSVEPGSGSSIMAYAGICQQDNLQPHSDPYWAPKSYEEILALVTRDSPPINEVQTVSLRDFDGTDSFTLGFDGKTTTPIVRGTNYTAAGIAAALQGPSEVQTVALAGYDTDGDSYKLSFGGASSHAIVRGQNNTAAGVTNAILGGNEQQQVVLTGFNTTTGTLKVVAGGVESTVLGAGGATFTNANIAAAINALLGTTGTASVTGAGATGFTVTFAGALANTDVPAISIVSSATAATVREVAKGGVALAGFPAGTTVSVGTVTDAGYTLTFGGTAQGIDFAGFSVTEPSGVEATVTETTKGAPGILPVGATAAVTGFGGGTFNDTGFQVTFGGPLGALNLASLVLTPAEGATGFVGETAKGGPIDNKGNTITPTGNHAPDVTVPTGYTIPPRTPFALTGSATDPDGDALTYMWEQNDPAGIQGETTAGTALVNQTKTNGVIFRQLGIGADISLADSLKYHSPGLNLAGTNPTRTFPDMLQILADNTNARTGRCEVTVPPAPTALPVPTRECFAEWLPTFEYKGFLSDYSLTFRLTARDGKMAGGGLGFAQTKVTIAPLASPFRVTSQDVSQVVYGTTKQTVTWNVGGTDVAPINVANVKISISTDGGLTYPTVLAESTPNDGAHEVTFPSVNATKARIKVEAVGNVFFDVSHADLTLVEAPTAPVGGTVPATLSLALGAPATFGAFTPGVAKEYTATTEATVLSTAGDATLTVVDPSTTNTGHLVNGAFALPQPLQGLGVVKTWSAPTSNEKVPVTFKQQINSGDALRTGTYSKSLTFTLSTTTP
jgi:hypothetical protein